MYNALSQGLFTIYMKKLVRQWFAQMVSKIAWWIRLAIYDVLKKT